MRNSTIVCTAAVLVTGNVVGQAVNGGNGTIYMATYADEILVIDESNFEVTGRIQSRNRIPLNIVPSEDGETFYVLDASFENVEIVNLAEGRSVDGFTLSRGDTKVRIWGFAVHPDETFALLVVNSYLKDIDRWEVSPPTLLRYDLQTKTVTDTIPWPDDEERDRVRMMFSPDGEFLYFFAGEILVLETDKFTEVDRWDLSYPLEDGMGRFSFGFPVQVHEQKGFYTGLFRITDPVQNRRMMGVARVNLAERQVDFSVLGPSEGVGFSLAPGGKKAFGLHSEVGNYQFWEFDVAGNKVVRKLNFDGRSRMSLIVSSNGRYLYIMNAGATIDVYDAVTFDHVRQFVYDGDMTDFMLVPPGSDR